MHLWYTFIMNYTNIKEAVFLERPNRFIAHCLLKGQPVVAHVPNTGRCKELLIPGSTVYLQEHDSAARKTKYTLITVSHNGSYINIDSQAANKVVYDYLLEGNLLPNMEEPIVQLKRECLFGKSRFDLRFDCQGNIGFAEVKSVTLCEDGYAVFPDAPTERGVKHVYELIEATKGGYPSYLIFLIQLHDAKGLKPNWKTHPQFGEALIAAKLAGVQLVAYSCIVSPERLSLDQQVPIILTR